MQRVADARARIPKDALLATRIGDFYEFFGPDAEAASKLLTITLTRRREIPMAGVPIWAKYKFFSQLANSRKLYVLEADESEPREFVP